MRTQVNQVDVRPDCNRCKLLALSRWLNVKTYGQSTLKTPGDRVEKASTNDCTRERYLSTVGQFFGTSVTGYCNSATYFINILNGNVSHFKHIPDVLYRRFPDHTHSQTILMYIRAWRIKYLNK
jgi:hypothetical protein